ncbi:MAG TPA: TolC family protein [Bryobacteraceae bacterium]|nr:TolC family protein [Bryobacteraceae bacterium]
MIQKAGIYRIVAFLTGGLCLGAQTQLGLADAVASALRSRPSLQAEAERVLVAEGLRRQAGLFPNPEFQFQNENLRPGQTYTRDVDTLALINQPLDILGKHRERVAAAGEDRGYAQAQYQLVRRQLAQRVKVAYWAARGAQEIRQAWNLTLENFARIIEFHQGRLTAGAIAEQDLLRVRLEGERLKVSADLATLEAGRARIELLREMGRTEITEVVLTETLEPPGEFTPVPIERVMAERLEIQVARAALRQAEANAKLQDISARPDLTVTLGYKRTQLPDALTGVNTALASLRITLPVFDKNQGNRAAAQAEVRRHQLLLSAAEADVRADYLAALQEYEFHREEFVKTLEPLRQHAAEISRIAAAAYAEGGTDLLRLLDAERVGLDAELARTTGLVEYRQSIAKLEAAEGMDQ